MDVEWFACSTGSPRCVHELSRVENYSPRDQLFEPKDRSLGFILELVAERNPYTMAVGQDLPVRLTYEGRSLAGALVVAINRSNPSDKLTARSDKDGRVRFRLPRTGVWLIKAVHMIPAQPGVGAEWSSYWASLTFGYAR